MTRVSVIIAAYNVEKYIARAIHSALDQAGVDLEVIVIDDCSTDQTRTIARNINDPRLRLICLSQNGGPGASRNAGLAAAQGDWIAILDGDDAFAPGRLARMIQIAGPQNADIVVDNLMTLHEGEETQKPMFDTDYFATLDPLTLAKFIAGNPSFFGGVALGYLKPLFAASFLKAYQLSYDPDIRIGEDYLLMARALAEGARCVIDPNPGYLYTVRSGSISHRLKPDDMRRIESLDQKFQAEHPLSGEAQTAQTSRTRHIREALAFTLLVEAIKAGRVRDALRAVHMAPRSLLLLRLPVASRLRRLYDKVFKP